MRLKSILSFLLATCVFSNNFAQQRNIVIDSGRNNGTYFFFLLPNEPCIAMDPKHPENLVAGANLRIYYSSSDGGYHWFRDTISSSYQVNGDPVTIADTNGSFYYFHLGTKKPGYYNTITCQRMDNISSHIWTDGTCPGIVDSGKNEDKPWAAVNRLNNEIVVTWTQYNANFGNTNPADSTLIYFSKSSDTGHSWTTPIRISKFGGDCSNRSNSVEGAMPAVGPYGEIYATWAHNDAILFNRSFDGGNTWQAVETQVSNSPGGWYYRDIAGVYRSPGLPFIGTDNSNGPFRGNVYINWQDQRDGVGNTNIWLSKSSDSGTTWSSPIKVNDDTTHREHFMNSMAVDAVTGYIYILFYDRRRYADSTTEVYLAVSKDGGSTFANFRISESPFRPKSSTFFGDYTGIVAYNNIVRPIWYEQRQVTPVLYDCLIKTAIIDSTITGTSVPNINKNDYNLQTYPNPFDETTNIIYDLPAPEMITLFITDIMGRKVSIIKNHQLTYGGRHIEHLNANTLGLTPGIYYLCFQTEKSSQTIKILRVR